MISTPVFLAAWAASTAVAALVIRSLPSEEGARRFASAFWTVTVALSAADFLASAGRSLRILPPGLLSPPASALFTYRLFVPLGVAAAAIALAAPARRQPVLGALVFSPRLRGALRLSIALAYAGFEIGKATHPAEMRQFFADSGLPAWLNPAVIAGETVLAAALFWPAAEIAAAAGLALILAGAIATHARTGDPFSDSLDAVHLLALLAGLVLLTVGARRHRMQGPEE